MYKIDTKFPIERYQLNSLPPSNQILSAIAFPFDKIESDSNMKIMNTAIIQERILRKITE